MVVQAPLPLDLFSPPPAASSSPVPIAGNGSDIASRPSSPRTPKTPNTGVDSSATSSTWFSLRTPNASTTLHPLTQASSQGQSPLMKTPGEILHRVFAVSGAEDAVALARAAKTCKELRTFIYENPDQALWRDIHLKLYDDPRTAGAFSHERQDTDWQTRVQDREFVRRIFREWDEERYHELPALLDHISQTLLDMYLDLPTIREPAPLTADSFEDDDFLSSPNPSTDPLNAPILYEILSSPLFQHIYYNLSLKEVKPLLRPLSGSTGSPLRRRSREPINPIISRLHCLLQPHFDPDDKKHAEFRGYLREVVYTGSNYNSKNEWGPLTPEGKVDWRLVDAISSVMMANAKDVLSMGEDSWKLVMKPISFGLEAVRGWGFQHLKRPDHLGPDDVWDWAGVEGPWCGSYAFLDYADWITLNEPRIIAMRRPATPHNQLDLSAYSEAIGDLLHITMVVDKPQPDYSSLQSSSSSASSSQFRSNPHNTTRGPHYDPTMVDLPILTSTLPTNPLLPPIYFHGSTTQGAQDVLDTNSNHGSYARGVVQLTADDPPQVRWTLVIRYGGEDRWKMEAIQVGGRGSRRGFFGIWTDAMKEDHSPNGPAFYWKK